VHSVRTWVTKIDEKIEGVLKDGTIARAFWRRQTCEDLLCLAVDRNFFTDFHCSELFRFFCR
jgi:hypothetical protein